MRARAKPINKFMAPGGTYERHLDMVYYHKFLVALLSSNICGKARWGKRKECNNDGVIMTQRDHAKQFQPWPNGGIMSEGFGNDRNTSMEGVTCKIKAVNKNKRKTVFYSHISDEKRQGAATVYTNIKDMLKDLFSKGYIVCAGTVKKILNYVDECDVQYRSGTALHFLSLLSFEYGLAYNLCEQSLIHAMCLHIKINKNTSLRRKFVLVTE